MKNPSSSPCCSARRWSMFVIVNALLPLAPIAATTTMKPISSSLVVNRPSRKRVAFAPGCYGRAGASCGSARRRSDIRPWLRNPLLATKTKADVETCAEEEGEGPSSLLIAPASPFTSMTLVDRRRVLMTATFLALSAGTAASAATITAPADPEELAAALSRSSIIGGGTTKKKKEPLEDLVVGEGRWRDSSEVSVEGEGLVDAGVVTDAFAAYLARFLIRYDPGAGAWWAELKRSHKLLPSAEARRREEGQFGPFAFSVAEAVRSFVLLEDGGGGNRDERIRGRMASLFDLTAARYGKDGANKEAMRQIGLLFALLPPRYQPAERIAEKCGSVITTKVPSSGNVDELSPKFAQDFSALLPDGYRLVRDPDGLRKSYMVSPSPRLVSESANVAAGEGMFGPVASGMLKRNRCELSPDVYALLGISGGAGCAITHTLVIPLDVVKTRIQTDPTLGAGGGEGDAAGGGGGGIWNGAQTIIDNEGIGALLLGMQATIAGYTWYGISVYPSYAFFKLFLSGESVLSPEYAAAHANDVALVAGAMASVVASLGLTPLEAARIRAVAEPETYRDLGLIGTLGFIANEDPATPGWKALYAGLPSLMTRQVIFGSVKFLAFERACEAIFATFPELRNAVVTSLGVSLVAGGFAGTLSSVVSQPADSVLTYVARQGGGELGVFDGARTMIREDGAGSLFRGLGSRCVWAGCIIAGQFLLYDVFRSMFGITGEDLSQVFEVVIPNQ